MAWALGLQLKPRRGQAQPLDRSKISDWISERPPQSGLSVRLIEARRVRSDGLEIVGGEAGSDGEAEELRDRVGDGCGSVGVALRLAARQAEVFGRTDNRKAEFVEGGAVLLGGHLLVGLFMVARLGKLGAEKIEFGLQCGDFVVSWSWVVAPVP